jgi:RNA polymerase sigma factor (TIGR02999 family)
MSSNLHGDDPQAQALWLAAAYEELRRVAAGFLRGERRDHTWQVTDLVHEAVLRLLGADLRGQDRTQFLAAAICAMRRLLVEHARSRNTRKRGGDWRRVGLDDLSDSFQEQNLDIEAVHQAVERLATFHERQSQVITLHYFGEFAVKEIAVLLSVSVSTVESDLRIARAWLHGQLAGINA